MTFLIYKDATRSFYTNIATQKIDYIHEKKKTLL